MVETGILQVVAEDGGKSISEADSRDVVRSLDAVVAAASQALRVMTKPTERIGIPDAGEPAVPPSPVRIPRVPIRNLPA